MIEIKPKHLNVVLVIITIMLSVITASALGVFIFTLIQSVLIMGMLSVSGVVFLLGVLISGSGFFLTKYFFSFINSPIEDIVGSKNWFIGAMILSSIFLMLPVTGAIAVLLVFIFIYEKQDIDLPTETGSNDKPSTDKTSVKEKFNKSSLKATSEKEPTDNLPKLSKSEDPENDTKVANKDDLFTDEEEEIPSSKTSLKVAGPKINTKSLNDLKSRMNKK